MIKRCVPSKLGEKMNDDIPMSCSKEDKLDRILCILESHRESTLNGLPDALRNTATKIVNDSKATLESLNQIMEMMIIAPQILRVILLGTNLDVLRYINSKLLKKELIS